MELQWPPPPILFALFLLLLMLTRRGGGSSRSPTRLPPGPRGLPIIGSLHLVTSLPHRCLRDLAREHGPLMHLKLGQVPTVVVSSPEMAREVMKTHDLVFANRPEILAGKVLGYGCTDIVFAPYGNYWRQLRKICILELLSAKRVQSFRRIREEEVFNLIESIRPAGDALRPVNLTKKLYGLSNTITSRVMFGKKCTQLGKFLAAQREALELATGFNVADLFPSLGFVNVISGMKFKLERTRRKLDSIFDEIIEERKSKRAREGSYNKVDAEEEDLLDVLLRIQEDGDLDFPLTSENVKAVILDMFGAGTETSATCLVWTMAELMRNPKTMQKARGEVRGVVDRRGKVVIDESSAIDDMNYLRMVIKESLRLHPPLPLLFPRESSQRCEVGGYDIPAKARVIVNAWAIGRDPALWKNAEAFDPGRFEGNPADYRGGSFEYIPFGAGRRICPGVLFGLATVETALAQLLYHFNWEIPGGGEPGDLDMDEVLGVSVTRKADLCLFAESYVPSGADEI